MTGQRERAPDHSTSGDRCSRVNVSRLAKCDDRHGNNSAMEPATARAQNNSSVILLHRPESETMQKGKRTTASEAVLRNGISP
jgi:hypothetical protein